MRRLILVGAWVAALGSMANAHGASAARDRLLASTTWLAGHLKDPDVIVWHAGMGGDRDYRSGHIPGARWAPMETFSRRVTTPGGVDLMLELPDPATLHDTLVRYGVTDRSRIVVYAAPDSLTEATRILFTLDYAGLGERSALLQGGFAAWRGEGRPVTQDLPEPAKAGTLAPLSTRPLTVDAAFLQANAGAPGLVLLDARDEASYDGLASRVPDIPAGHIPGARSMNFRSLYALSGALETPDVLEAAFTRAGVKPGDRIIGYCWLGEFATGTLFAARTLGYDVRLYDGSMSDWTQRKLPLEKVKK